MAKSVKIYQDAVDKNVAKTMIFIDGTTAGTYYWDAEFTKVVSAEELRNLYVKGVIVYDSDTDNYYSPIGFGLTPYSSEEPSILIISDIINVLMMGPSAGGNDNDPPAGGNDNDPPAGGNDNDPPAGGVAV